MRIKRVQVEEGFLDGLDVSFTQGLNVIIGERGTGKTSLIELIRFCLGVQGYTPKSTMRSKNHAMSVLGSGQVSVTLVDGERDILVPRTATDESQRATAPFVPPIVFSQTEIETVGLQARSRIRLLDGFCGDQTEARTRESEAASEVRSLTTQAEVLRREIAQISDQLKQITNLDIQIADLVPQEQKLGKVLAHAKEKKTRLDKISAEIAATAVSIGAIQRFLQSISKWEADLSAVVSSAPIVEPWPDGAGLDALSGCRGGVRLATDQLKKALDDVQRIATGAERQARLSQTKKLELEGRARHPAPSNRAYFKRPRLSIPSPPNWNALRNGSISTRNCSRRSAAALRAPPAAVAMA